MKGTKNLTQGPILKQLFTLAMPIMATSFIQMAYSLTDMAWVGRIGSEAIAAVGSVGILTWMSTSISLLNKVGSEVSVGQAIGAQNEQATRAFASHNLTLSLLISLSWGALLFIFATPIISIYELEPHIAKMAVEYLRIIATAFPFVFLSAAFTGIFNAAGRSKIPFSINGIGLITNMILDPLFIFGLNWGTTGAAIATWLAEATVCILFIYQLKQKKILWDDFRLFTTLKKTIYTPHLENRITSSGTQYIIRFRQYVSRKDRNRARWSFRADGTHYRRTNRSYHLEHLPRIFYSSQCFCSSELCSTANLPCTESLSHHFMDDIYIRIFLHISFYMLRKRNIFYLCS